MKENNHYKKIFSWTEIEDVYDIALSKAKDGDIFVEVGVWLGRSICYLGESAKRLGKSIDIHAVDWFKGSSKEDNDTLKYGDQRTEFEENLTLQKIQVMIHEGLSHEIAEEFKNESVFCVFIDADHSYEAVKRDLNVYFPKIKKGGMLSGHDYGAHVHHGSTRAIDEFVQENSLQLQFSNDLYCWYVIK